MNKSDENLNSAPAHVYTRSEVRLRLALYIIIAMNTAALGDAWLREEAPKWVFTMLSCGGAGLLAWRAFIDRTTDTETKEDTEAAEES